MDKTICELFAGVGGFRLGFDRLQSGWDTVWFSQWEPKASIQHAHNCYVEHFGDCKDLKGEYHTGEDISTVDKYYIPDHNLLVGGFPCLASDSLILTKDGYKKIVDVTTDDKVLSIAGKYERVLNVFDQGEKETFSLSGYGFNDIQATDNHKFYVSFRTYKRHGEKKTKIFTEPDWVSVDEIRKHHPKDVYFVDVINKNKKLFNWKGVKFFKNNTTESIKKDIDVTDIDLWYLCGCYLGDGWLGHRKAGTHRCYDSKVILGVNKKKLGKIAGRLADKYHFSVIEEKTVIKMSFSSIELASFMKMFGEGADNKQIPGFVFDLPVKYIKALLNGYTDTDGCIMDDRYQYSTISEKLAYGISHLLQKVYRKPVKIHQVRVSPTHVIAGRIVNQHDVYVVRMRTKRISHESAFYKNGYVYKPLNRIESCGKKHVYDIEVENTHCFIVNGVLSHNCQDYSVAHTLKNSKGIEGKKGVLWWQIRDVIKAKRPTFCIFENVDRLLKSPAKQRGRDFGIILGCLNNLGYNVEWRVVNAAEYGAAQKRKRTFIFACRHDSKCGAYMFRHNPKALIMNDGFMAKAFPVWEMCGDMKTRNLGTDIVKISDDFSFDFENAGVMIGGGIATAKVTATIEPFIKLGSILQHNVDKKYFLDKDKADKFEYLKGSKRIKRVSSDGHEYIYSEGAMSYPDAWDMPGRTMLTSEGTVNRSTHVVEDLDNHKFRLITPVEAERLQGFDDNWTNTGMTERMRYFCMGNSLVVPMITRMGKVLDDIIAKE